MNEAAKRFGGYINKKRKVAGIMAKQSLYALMEDEKVVFELNIDSFEMDEERGGLLGGILNLLNLQDLLDIIPILNISNSNKKRAGIFVVTNMRCIVATISEYKFLDCCSCCEDREFAMFPLSALNGCNGYEKSRKCCCSGFSISVGLTVGASNETLTIKTNDIHTDEQAQAVVAKLATLVQKA